MSDGNLGKAIEKIIGRIKDDMKEKEVEGTEDAPAVASVASGMTEKVYLKAVSLHTFDELDAIKQEVKAGNILIIRINPLAEKGIDDVKRAVGELSEFADLIKGDIARLGEGRIVLTPSFVRIWREKPAASEAVVPSDATEA